MSSATFFAKAIEAREYGEKERYATINYLIGELFRRAGDFDSAIKFYDLAINDENKRDWVLEVATKQKELATKRDEDNTI